jgi:hypothetical protein
MHRRDDTNDPAPIHRPGGVIDATPVQAALRAGHDFGGQFDEKLIGAGGVGVVARGDGRALGGQRCVYVGNSSAPTWSATCIATAD